MHITVLYIMTICFFLAIVNKANKQRPEWLMLLIILSFLKTCIMYLFQNTTVFTLITIGATQIHLDDVVLAISLLYCILNFTHPLKGGMFIASTLLLLFPVGISLFRGLLSGAMNAETFLSDTRKYILFVTVFYATYILTRKERTIDRLWKLEQYADNTMKMLLLYIIVIWILDIVFGINGLPGQVMGTKSDGGSTFRIIHALQVYVIALYVLYRIYRDLRGMGQLSFMTLTYSVVIVLMQWRTIVASFGFAAFILFICSIKKYGITKKLFAEIMFLVIFGAIMMLLGNSKDGLISMVTNLFDSYSNIGKGVGTFSTRTEAWTLILSSLQGIDVILGRPFGQSLNISWAHSAHSGYVDYIAKMGYLGLIFLIMFIIFLLVQTVRNKDYLCMAIICSFIILWIGYGFSVEQGAILGFILAIQEEKCKIAVGEH